jgi:putative tryptophan/tyrosine transport system substrate-binding protein
MKRREFLSGSAAVVAVWPTDMSAQPNRVAKIGILTTGNQLSSPVIEKFRQEMRDRGYLEGRDITIEFRSSALEPERLPQLAAELVRIPVDVLVTDSNVSGLAAKQATSVIPIVAVMGGEPVAAGLIKSYSHPGGNVTGFTLLAPELGTKRLEILKDTLPTAKRIGVLWNSVNVLNAKEQMNTIARAANRLGLELSTTTIQHRDEIAAAFDKLKAENASAVMTLADAMMFAERQRVVDAALKTKLPGIFPERPFAQAGGLLSYGPDVLDVFKRAAGYVDRLLKGAKADDLPFEQPARFELAINLKSANALSITIPPTLLARADEVIE